MPDTPTYEELEQRIRELEEKCSLRRRDQADLGDNDATYRSFFHNAPLPYQSLDENARITEVNPAWLTTFGYRKEEVLGRKFSDFLPPDWRLYFDNNFREITTSGFSYVRQLRIRHKDGRLLDISLDGCSSYGSDGRFLGSNCILKDITDLKQAEDRLYLTQCSIDSVNDCIFWIDEEGRFSSVNDATCHKLGYSRRELLTMGVFDVDPFFPREKWLKHWENLMQGGCLTFETVHSTREGRMFPVEVTINRLDYRGKSYNCAIARDISKRVRITEELNQFKYVLDNTLDMIFMFDAETLQFVYFNRGALESLLYGKDELLQLHPYDIKPHFSEQVFRKIIAPLLEGDEEVLHYETIHRRKNGEDFPVEVTLQLVRSPDGAQRFVAIVRDITARRKSEEALVRIKKEWEDTFDAMPDIVTIQNEEMRIVRANKKAHEIFGVEPGVLTGKYCYQVFRGTGEPCPECPALSTFQDYGHHREIITHKNLGRIFNVTSSSILDENGDFLYVINIVKDITEYKKLESQLLQEQKIESIGSLAGGIAHDFNNILMGLFGNISLARLELDSSHPAHETLENAEQAMNRATRLTNQLLTFARGGEPVKKVVRLDDLVKESVRDSLSGSQVEAVYNLAEDQWLVEVDRGQMEQVFANLALNAEQAMPGGGRLCICMESTELREEEVVHLTAGQYYRITVQDEGKGIAPDHLDRIFDPYFSTRDTGRGLGLATVYSIINKHGGHITVVSEPGQGTVFTIYLPAGTAEQLPETKADDLSDRTVRHNPRILLMDDEEMVRNVSEKMLNRNGFSVVTAVNGTEAIDKYRQAMGGDETFDLVIMDLSVPGGMGGEETIRELLKIDPDVRAVISSGYAEDPVMANYAAYGFKGFVEKPFKIKQLLDVSYRVLQLDRG